MYWCSSWPLSHDVSTTPWRHYLYDNGRRWLVRFNPRKSRPNNDDRNAPITGDHGKWCRPHRLRKTCSKQMKCRDLSAQVTTLWDTIIWYTSLLTLFMIGLKGYCSFLPAVKESHTLGKLLQTVLLGQNNACWKHWKENSLESDKHERNFQAMWMQNILTEAKMFTLTYL